MNKETSASLRVMADKNTIWPKLLLTVRLWSGCIDTRIIVESQIRRFEDLLLGALVVAHDKGNPIKLYRSVDLRHVVETYNTPLMWALDMSGIGPKCLGGTIRRTTVYPNGSIKVIHIDGEVEWL